MSYFVLLNASRELNHPPLVYPREQLKMCHSLDHSDTLCWVLTMNRLGHFKTQTLLTNEFFAIILNMYCADQ